jgi:hypothetical protein
VGHFYFGAVGQFYVGANSMTSRTNMGPGPKRGQVTLFLERDQPMKSVTNYQLYGHCAYMFVAPDRKTGANSGTTLMTGPGPHYRVAADCNCLEGRGDRRTATVN